MIVELIKAGEGVALPLPEDVLRRLGLKPGDKVALSIGKDGEVTIVPDHGNDADDRLINEILTTYDETFKALSK